MKYFSPLNHKPALGHYCHMSSINELGNVEYAFFISGTFPFFSIFYPKTCQFLIHQETTQEKAGPSTLPSAVESSLPNSSNPASTRQLRESSGIRKSKVERPKVIRPQQLIRRCLSILDCLSGMRRKIF